jgi:transglutaminase-like putative cysteine protease
MVKRIRITHQTAYYYREPVTFGTHYALVRPREGHDVRIVSSRLEIQPAASVHWLRDIYGNSIATIKFSESGNLLRVLSEVDVDLYDDVPIEWVIDESAQSYPFQYAAHEQVELVPYRLPSYPESGTALQKWLLELYQPGDPVDTSELLNRLNTWIYASLEYRHRNEHGVQTPAQTIELGTGSCRDYAVLMMEAARLWGFAARFVTGYIQLAEGQHGATHAWTEIYLPGAGWRGFDPTNNKLASSEHVSVAVAREQEKACPLHGTWEGPANAFDRLEVSVQVVSQQV